MGSPQDKSRQQIQEQTEFWDRHFREKRKLREELLQRELPPDWWRLAHRMVWEERRRAREYLLNEYGIEIQIPDWLMRILVRELRRGASPEQILGLRSVLGPPLVADPARILERAEQRPFTKADTHRIRTATWTHTLFSGMRWFMLEAFENIGSVEDVQRVQTGQPLPPETAQALNRAAVDILTNPYLLAGLVGGVMRWSPDREEVEAVTTSLAGFVEAQSSGDAKQRRNAALSEEEQLDALRGSVLRAWLAWEEEDRPPDEPIYGGTGDVSFVSRVNALLVRLGNQVDQNPKWVAREPLDAEQFAAREYAARQQLNELKEHAGLKARENTTLEMRLAGHTYGEIAAREDVSERTSKADYKNAVAKLKRAAGQ